MPPPHISSAGARLRRARAGAGAPMAGACAARASCAVRRWHVERTLWPTRVTMHARVTSRVPYVSPTFVPSHGARVRDYVYCKVPDDLRILRRIIRSTIWQVQADPVGDPT